MKNSDDSGYTGKHVGVCVLDTGIFPHIDFKGRILAFHDFIGHRIKPYDDNSHGTHAVSYTHLDVYKRQVTLYLVWMMEHRIMKRQRSCCRWNTIRVCGGLL